MRVFVAWASGAIGTALVPQLADRLIAENAQYLSWPDGAPETPDVGAAAR